MRFGRNCWNDRWSQLTRRLTKVVQSVNAINRICDAVNQTSRLDSSIFFSFSIWKFPRLMKFNNKTRSMKPLQQNRARNSVLTGDTWMSYHYILVSAIQRLISFEASKMPRNIHFARSLRALWFTSVPISISVNHAFRTAFLSVPLNSFVSSILCELLWPLSTEKQEKDDEYLCIYRLHVRISADARTERS